MKSTPQRQAYDHQYHLKHIHQRRAKSLRTYYRNVDVKRATARRKAAENRELLKAARSVPCLDCVSSFPWFVMEFDHTRGVKEFTIGARSANSITRILGELEKCDIVCANCHRVRTYVRRRFRAERHLDVSEFAALEGIDIEIVRRVVDALKNGGSDGCAETSTDRARR